jgi:hypothetical protein
VLAFGAVAAFAAAAFFAAGLGALVGFAVVLLCGLGRAVGCACVDEQMLALATCTQAQSSCSQLKSLRHLQTPPVTDSDNATSNRTTAQATAPWAGLACKHLLLQTLWNTSADITRAIKEATKFPASARPSGTKSKHGHSAAHQPLAALLML